MDFSVEQLILSLLLHPVLVLDSQFSYGLSGLASCREINLGVGETSKNVLM